VIGPQRVDGDEKKVALRRPERSAPPPERGCDGDDRRDGDAGGDCNGRRSTHDE